MKLFILIATSLATLTLQAELFFTEQMRATHLATYTDQEKQLLEKDLATVRSVCLDGTQNAPTRFYLATAGAPGSRKTTILEKFVASHPEYQAGVYLDPDPRTLRFMAHTYYAQSLNPLAISCANSYDQVIKSAYEKWRAGSNYIVLTLFEEAVAAGRSIIYGTTSTGVHIPQFFQQLKENGYQIILLLCSCPDSLRYQAIEYRNKEVRFYQSSPEDAVAKGRFFPQRMDAYFTYADQIYFYWSDELFSHETLAATWQKGQLDIHNDVAMKNFIDQYEKDRATLSSEGCILPSFESYVQSTRDE